MSENSKPFKSGFVPITGLPNAGKSTLLNLLCAARISIISDKPQTTRNNILGILNGKGFQAVFVDTPGFLKARNKFEQVMESSIKRAAREDGDVCILVAEPEIPPEAKLPLFDQIKAIKIPLFLAVNKIDKVDQKKADEAAEFYKSILPVTQTFFISALNGKNVNLLRKAIKEILPEHPAYYPVDQITDKWERFYAAEIIREHIFKQFSMEIPYSCAVQIESFRETEGMPNEIYATIHTAKEGQKAIIIGKGGRALKQLREVSERAIKDFIMRDVQLHIHIKVTPDWQNNIEFLRETGLYEKK